MEERRAAERNPVRRKVMYGLTGPKLTGHTLDISENGMAVESQIVFPRKRRIVINLYTGNEIIELDGLVVWTLKTPSSFIYRMGIKFTSRVDAFKYLQPTLSESLKRIFLPLMNKKLC